MIALGLRRFLRRVAQPQFQPSFSAFVSVRRQDQFAHLSAVPCPAAQ